MRGKEGGSRLGFCRSGNRAEEQPEKHSRSTSNRPQDGHIPGKQRKGRESQESGVFDRSIWVSAGAIGRDGTPGMVGLREKVRVLFWNSRLCAKPAPCSVSL